MTAPTPTVQSAPSHAGPAVRQHPLATFLYSFILLAILKRSSLFEPYHWDALGYVAGTSLDMLDNGFRLVRPYTTGHPPLYCLTLALLWKAFGTSLVVGHALNIALGALALTFTYRLGESLSGAPVGAAALLLTLASPIFFAQVGTLNVVAAICALGVTSAYLYLRGSPRAFAITSAALYLTHQPALLFAVAFGTHACIEGLRHRNARDLARSLVPILLGLVPIFCWDVYITHTAGGFLHPAWMQNYPKFWATLGRDVVHHFLLDDTLDHASRFNWIVSGAIVIALTARPRVPRWSAPERSFAILSTLVIAVHVVAFAWSDDLPRYFVPVLPFFYVMGAMAMARLLPTALSAWTVVAAAAAISALFTTGYHGERSAPGWQLESNLEYRDHIDTHLRAARFIEARYPDRVVVTCWPMNGELTDPRLGYVSHRIVVETDPSNAPPDALFYDSTESPCRGGEFDTWRRQAPVVARFEQSGKSATLFRIAE